MQHSVFHGARVALCLFLVNLDAAIPCWCVEVVKGCASACGAPLAHTGALVAL